MLQKASWPQRREVCHGFIVGSFASDWRDECLGLGNGGGGECSLPARKWVNKWTKKLAAEAGLLEGRGLL